MMFVRFVCAMVAFIFISQSTGFAQTRELGPTGLPIPRFVSLKSDEINVRVGPSQKHDIAWIFRKAGVPVEVTQEFENWRRIRDVDGEEGWIFHSLLSGKRTAMVAPAQKETLFDLLVKPDEAANLVAQVESRVIVAIENCDDTWCEVLADQSRGYILKRLLWGVYPDETL